MEIEQLVGDTEAHERRLSAHLKAAKEASSGSRHADAAAAFKSAHELSPDEPFLVHQWALATYKSKSPSEEMALLQGLDIINALQPETSNDPETLGITGAIYKRLWLLKEEREALDRAISYYGRGFEVRRDYYNGENLATCLDYRSKIQTDASEAHYDRMTASKVRESIVANLTEAMKAESFEDRTDRKWVFATLANCSFALGDSVNGNQYEALFLKEDPSQWETETYEAGKAAALDK